MVAFTMVVSQNLGSDYSLKLQFRTNISNHHNACQPPAPTPTFQLSTAARKTAHLKMNQTHNGQSEAMDVEPASRKPEPSMWPMRIPGAEKPVSEKLDVVSMSRQLELLLDSPPHCSEHDYPMSRNSEEDLQVMKYWSLPMTHRAKQEGWNILANDVEFQDRLTKGQGARGVAFKARWNRTDVVVVVHSETEQNPESAEALQELALLTRNLRHPNLVMFLGACVDVSPALLVYERMGSSVHEVMTKGRLWKRKWTPPPDLFLRWSQHLTLALAFLHGRDPSTIHGEITPANLFLSDDLQTLKLGNFGFAAANYEKAPGDEDSSNGELDKLPKSESNARKMRDRFASPETLLRLIGETKESNVFSATAVIWFMATGNVVRTPGDIAPDAARSSLPSPLGAGGQTGVHHKSPLLKDLIRRGLCASPAARPSAEQMAHTFKVLAREHENKQQQATMVAPKANRKSSFSRVVSVSPEWVRNMLGEF